MTGLLVALLLGCAPRPQPPNLLLVIVDTLRADALACYGGPAEVGDALCRLADTGTRFAWAFATAPYTAPSVASILTSRYPSEHRLSQFSFDPLDEASLTVAEVLAESGYATAAFVSNPVIQGRRNLGQGFQVWDDRMGRAERNRPDYRERVAADTAEAALAWAREARSPWFLLVHFQDPHGPYAPPGAAPAEDRPGAKTLPVLPHSSGYRGIPRYQALAGVGSVEAYRARYAAEIRYLDRHLGRLVAALDALGRPPAILLTADHGEALGEDDFYFAHGHSLGIDQIRVPLLWRPARPQAARVVAQPVSTLDVAPTLLRAAGVEIPTSFRGVPLPLEPVSAAGRGARAPFFAEHPVRRAVVAGDLYYARDLVSLERPVRDPNSNGRLRPLAPRAARLGVDGGFAGYGPAPEAARERLEAALAERSQEEPVPEVDEASRALLRSLGYVD